MLPQAKTAPKQNLEDFTILLFGPPKIGKSTLASGFDSPLFLATEAGLNALEVYQAPIATWEDFLAACKDLATGKHEFKTVVIDTIDNLHRFCREYLRKKHGFSHESELSFGRGYDLVKDEFLRALTKLSLLPYGLIMISHAEYMEIKTRTSTINKAVPTLQKNAREIVLRMADIILYAESIATEDKGETRVMHTRASEGFDAGDRTKRLPAVLPLDFESFKEAFYAKSDK